MKKNVVNNVMAPQVDIRSMKVSKEVPILFLVFNGNNWVFCLIISVFPFSIAPGFLPHADQVESATNDGP
jgi:hypothetical protein